MLLQLLSDIQEAGKQTAQTIATIGNGTAGVIADAAKQADNFRIALWSGIDRSQRSVRQMAQDLRPAPAVVEEQEVQHAAAPKRTYRTSLQPKDNRFLLASLHLSITDNWNVPLIHTPVVLFSTPKVAVTDDEGIATFHDVETGEHNLEIHLPNGSIQTRQLIVEPPSGLRPGEITDPIEVVLPVIRITVTDTLHGSAGTPAWLLPVIILISLLALSNTVLLALYLRKRKV